MTTAVEERRARLRGMWAAVAPAWGRAADEIDARGAPVVERMLAMAEVRTGDRVIELACGAGGTGLAALPLVGPGGRVVLSDAVDGMVAAAGARVRSRSLANVDVRVREMEAIDEPDRSFDVVLCREALMLAAEPERATGEIHRVLRPGGRVAVAVWGPRERNPWLGVVFDLVGDALGAPMPPPGVPGPFALSDAGGLATLLRGAGLEGVEVVEVAVPLRAASPDQWWDRAGALAGPLALRLAGLAPRQREALRERAREEARPYAVPGGLEMPGVSLVACGRRPG